jgi:hypothetical protein
VSDGRNEPRGNRDPYSEGTAASRLLAKMDGTHHDVKPDERELRMVRMWIETSATYPGTYAALGNSMFHVGLPMGEMLQRCGACHGGKDKDDDGKERSILVIRGRSHRALEMYQNLDRPERSVLLRAPLAKATGGLGLCTNTVFADTKDPLYTSMLAALEGTRKQLAAEKRFDMPGFRPTGHYLREMARFGVLPAIPAPGEAVDPYALDRKYWDLFDYRPEVRTAAR